MADTNVQSESASATSGLAAELGQLHERVRKMEALLRGADSILSTIRYDSELCWEPADGHKKDTHRRCYNMIEFLGDQLDQWSKAEADLDFASDDIWDLAGKAKQGRITIVERVDA